MIMTEVLMKEMMEIVTGKVMIMKKDNKNHRSNRLNINKNTHNNQKNKQKKKIYLSKRIFIDF